MSLNTSPQQSNLTSIFFKSTFIGLAIITSFVLVGFAVLNALDNNNTETTGLALTIAILSIVLIPILMAPFIALGGFVLKLWKVKKTLQLVLISIVPLGILTHMAFIFSSSNFILWSIFCIGFAISFGALATCLNLTKNTLRIFLIISSIILIPIFTVIVSIGASTLVFGISSYNSLKEIKFQLYKPGSLPQEFTLKGAYYSNQELNLVYTGKATSSNSLSNNLAIFKQTNSPVNYTPANCPTLNREKLSNEVCTEIGKTTDGNSVYALKTNYEPYYIATAWIKKADTLISIQPPFNREPKKGENNSDKLTTTWSTSEIIGVFSSIQTITITDLQNVNFCTNFDCN